jgi:hypothetical protein
MTLEGGGGGIISSIGDAFSGVGDALSGVFESIDSNLVNLDKTVGDVVPGGWATVAAIAVPYAAPMITGAALTAGQAAALAAGTRAATGAIKGEDPEDILKGAALAAAGSYGLGSLGGESIDLPSDTPYIDMPDGAELLTPESIYVPDEAAGPYISPDSYIQPDMDLNAPYIDASDGEVLLTPDSGADSTFTPKGTLSPEEQFAKDNYVPSELRSPDYVDPTYIPSELNLGNLYQNLPDGATQLGYSPDELAAITSSSTPNPLSQEEQYEKFYKEFLNNPQNPRPNFLDDPLKNISNRASDALDYLQNAPEKTYDYLTKTPIKKMGSDLYDFAGRNYKEIGLGALALSSMGGQQPQPQGQPSTVDSRYTGGYGSSGGIASPYLLRNRVNASNIYEYENPFDRYATVNRRYAKGGEVKHFAFGGISNALTRFTQPIEKAIVQPVGQALPFLKDVAPYAGILAAPFITNPAMAVGVGALSSGFGRPGSGFDMKRALMGGIAAYGASTLGAGVEAAGTEPVATTTSNLISAPPGTVGEGLVNQTSNLVKEAPKGFFRDIDAMQKGVGNLLSSDSDAATKAFSTKAGTFKSGVPIVMGTSGMMAIDEANKMREEAELAAGPARQENADMLARIAKGKKRAEDAVRANPYMYAMGGQVDDELGGDYSAMGMDQGNLQKGLFGLGYAEGGVAKKPISYKNIDIKDELNMPTGKSAQELEGSLPIDNAYLIARLRSMRGIPNEGIVEQGIGANIPIGDSRLNAMVNQDRMMNRRYELGGNTPFLGGELSGMMSKTEGRDPMFNIGYKKQFVEGGMPRFLSGGGDGMSDSIKANIEGTQEARLADGEFVIPADVVSHLGNGSSKAGAKQLYSMMDRVRKARTGNEKQGRQIKPNKMMPA